MTHGKVESYLCALLIDLSKEASFLIRDYLVGEGGGGDMGDDVGQKAS